MDNESSDRFPNILLNTEEPEDIQTVSADGPDRYADVVIVGAGRAGYHLASSLSRSGYQLNLFDAEPWPPYDRVRLSDVLSDKAREKDIYFDLSCFADNRNIELIKKRVISIDTASRTVQSGDLERTHYRTLILCTGSSPRKPALRGIDLRGVHTFRDLGDAKRIMERAGEAASAVVVGGGYLGLETAFGLYKRGVACTIVETRDQLMPGYLDASAAARLRARFEQLGIQVLTSRSISAINDGGVGHVASVSLDDGTVLDASIAVICIGVQPNIDLARQAGLAVNRGILVDDTLRTSDPAIYAVGECAEHRGRIYGLAGPVIEQAEVALKAITGRDASYQGSIAASSLKIAGIDLFVAGRMPQPAEDSGVRIYAYQTTKGEAYRAIAYENGQIVGAVVLGAWEQIRQLRQAIESRETLKPKVLKRFSKTGRLWRDARAASAKALPQDAVICNCRLVTKQMIEATIEKGARTTSEVSEASGAAQLCGSCKGLVEELVTGQQTTTRTPFASLIALFSLIALAGSLAILAAPPWPLTHSAGTSFQIDQLWTNGFWKQVTGFSLVALMAIANLLFLRKQSVRGVPGSYATWRLVHVGLGAAMLILLVLHTGLQLGQNLNSWLMASVLATLLAGSALGVATALEGRVGSRSASGGVSLRRLSTWLHILVAWPLPLLLGLHILMVYYF